MPYQKQLETDVMFVDYGKLKEGHDKSVTHVLKEGENLEGLILEIRQHEKFGHTYRVKAKGIEKQILLMGNKNLNKEMLGIGLNDEQLANFIPVVEGDKVKITYNGTYPTEKGNPGYSITVEVDR